MSKDRKSMRRFIGIYVLLFLFLISTLSPVISLLSTDVVIRNHGTIVRIRPLHVEGRFIKNDLGNVVSLRGVNKPGFEDDYTGWWVPEDSRQGTGMFKWNLQAVKANLQEMRSWGFNVVRLVHSIDWWLFDNATTHYIENIKNVITLAEEIGLYVIFTPYQVKHFPEGSQDPLPYPPYQSGDFSNIIRNEDDFVNYWIDVATELSEFSNVIFELWNEPHGSQEAKGSWFNVSQRCVDEIREVTDHLIIFQWGYDIWIGMGSAQGDLSWIEEVSLDGANIVYSTHIYRDSLDQGGERWGGNWYDYDTINKSLTHLGVRYVLESLDKPLLIGEIGANVWFVGLEFEHEIAFFNNTLTFLNELEIGYLAWWWRNSGSHTLFQLGEPFMPPPNQVGQILIDSILDGTRL